MSIDFVELSKTKQLKNVVPGNEEVLMHLKDYMQYLHDCFESYNMPVPFAVRVTGSDRDGCEVIGHVTANWLTNRYIDYGQNAPFGLVAATGSLYKCVRSFVRIAASRRTDILKIFTTLEDVINNLTEDSWQARYSCPPKDVNERLDRMMDSINLLVNEVDNNAAEPTRDV